MTKTIYDKVWASRGWLGRSITISILLHVGLLIASGFIIILRSKLSPPAQFSAIPPARPRLEPHKVEMAVKVQDLSKASARPRLQPRIVVEEPSDLILPEIKALPDTARRRAQREFSTVGMTGPGRGPGGGYGDGLGGGIGGGLPIILSGRCDPITRMERLEENGGDPRCEVAVRKGLQWLAAHQKVDGSWGGNNPCASTGIALLAFLGHCDTPNNGPYGKKLANAIHYLLGVSTDHGGQLAVHSGNQLPYEHAIATYALCETYTMTKDPSLIQPIKYAVSLIVTKQTRQGGWVYGYGSGFGGIDTSCTGWNVQALKAAVLTELRLPGVEEALDRAIVGLKGMQSGNGHWNYRGDVRQPHPTLTGIGISCLAFWKEAHSKEARKAAQAVNAYFAPNYRDGKTHLYAWYYNTLGTFQMGGTAWSVWQGKFQNAVVNAQNGDGSWPAAADPWFKDAAGAVYRTALCTLMLEVYYRYLPTG